jgi:NAD-dependent deacetylase
MLLRPDVVWFGESLPQDILQAAFRVASQARLMLVVGTSALVQPAASLPLLAQRNGATLLEINLEMTPLSSYVDELVCGPVGQILPEWWQTVQHHK